MTRKNIERIQTLPGDAPENEVSLDPVASEASDDAVADSEACEAQVANWPGTFSPYANEQFRADELRRAALSLAIEYATKVARPDRIDVLTAAREFHAFLSGDTGGE